MSVPPSDDPDGAISDDAVGCIGSGAGGLMGGASGEGGFVLGDSISPRALTGGGADGIVSGDGAGIGCVVLGIGGLDGFDDCEAAGDAMNAALESSAAAIAMCLIMMKLLCVWPSERLGHKKVPALAISRAKLSSRTRCSRV